MGLKQGKQVIISTVSKGMLKCSDCGHEWSVQDLILERKAVACSLCGHLNDITQAMKNSNVIPEIVRERIVTTPSRKEK